MYHSKMIEHAEHISFPLNVLCSTTYVSATIKVQVQLTFLHFNSAADPNSNVFQLITELISTFQWGV
jgi:heme/copper-type cytochrome/quinol oxidase subunit 4